MTALSPITWFEIPVADLDRAGGFYETVLGITLNREVCPDTGHAMAVFPHREGAPSGCLMTGTGGVSTTDGSTLYLLLGGDLAAALSRAEGSGGRVLVPVTGLPGDMGRYAVIADSEGNRIGLHQMAL